MAEKGFGVKEVNLIGASGTPTITSPNNLNLNAVNVAISTNVSIGGTLTVSGSVSVGGTLTYEDVTNIDSIGIITARTGLKVLAGGANVVGVVTATSFTGSGANLTSLPAANLTGTLPAISGANLTGIAVTEAPVVDYTITADGGSNYYFHGGGVDETDGNPDLYLIRGQKYRFNNTTGSGHPFRFTSTGNSNAGYSNGVTGDEEGVQFWTIPYDAPAKLFYVCTIHGGMLGNIYIRGANGHNDNVGITTFSNNVRMSNTSKNLSVAGQILIGTTSGNEKLVVKRDDTTGPTLTLENNANLAYINNWGSVGGGSGRTNRFEINATTQAQASICAPYITFMTGGAGDTHEKIRITSAGNLKISNADKGIDFTEQTVGSVSGVSVTSELLDHYEEGTFTPFISAASSAPSVTYGGSERGGKYTRIGNIVFYSLGFRIDAYSGGSGQVYIGGFPYVGSGNPGWDGAHVFRDCDAIAINSRINQLGGWLETSTVSGYPIMYIQYHASTSNFGAASLQASSISTGRITIHGHYKIG